MWVCDPRGSAFDRGITNGPQRSLSQTSLRPINFQLKSARRGSRGESRGLCLTTVLLSQKQQIAQALQQILEVQYLHVQTTLFAKFGHPVFIHYIILMKGFLLAQTNTILWGKKRFVSWVRRTSPNRCAWSWQIGLNIVCSNISENFTLWIMRKDQWTGFNVCVFDSWAYWKSMTEQRESVLSFCCFDLRSDPHCSAMYLISQSVSVVTSHKAE